MIAAISGKIQEWKTLLFGAGFVLQLHVASLWLCSSIFFVILRPLLAAPS